MNARILVVEDEPAILELIAINLKHAGFEVTSAASAEAADEFVKAELPDAILLDWMLPGQSGMAFAKRLRAVERTRNLPIILLTARVHEEDKVQGLDSGADDYITKPFSPRELVSRLKAVLRRRAPHTSDERIESGGLSLNPATRIVMSDEVEISMSPTEFRLLAFLMTHPERVYSRTQLLDEVWGDHVFLDERTIDVHIRRLRAALEPVGHAERIATARGAGYCFRKA